MCPSPCVTVHGHLLFLAAASLYMHSQEEKQGLTCTIYWVNLQMAGHFDSGKF